MKFIRSKKKSSNQIMETFCECGFPGTDVAFLDVLDEINPNGTMKVFEAPEDSEDGWAPVSAGDVIIEFNGGKKDDPVLCLQFVIADGNMALNYADVDGEVIDDPDEFFQSLADFYNGEESDEDDEEDDDDDDDDDDDEDDDEYDEDDEDDDDDDDDDDDEDDDDDDDDDEDYDEDDDDEFEFSESDRENEEEEFEEDDDEDDDEDTNINISALGRKSKRR